MRLGERAHFLAINLGEPPALGAVADVVAVALPDHGHLLRWGGGAGMVLLGWHGGESHQTLSPRA